MTPENLIVGELSPMPELKSRFEPSKASRCRKRTCRKRQWQTILVFFDVLFRCGPVLCDDFKLDGGQWINSNRPNMSSEQDETGATVLKETLLPQSEFRAASIKTPCQCIAAMRDLEGPSATFPMYVVPLETVLVMEEVKSHQQLLQEGLLRTFDPALGKAMFVSHQWTSEEHPDPDAKQLKIFQKAMKNLLTGETVARPNAWAEMVFMLAGGARRFTASKLTESPILIWYDYFSVPQYRFSSRSLGENQLEDQRNAIASIPAYIDQCEFFVALCPLMKHATDQSTLSMASWDQRGWCRAEAIVRNLSVENGLTLVVESPQQVSLATTGAMLKAAGDGHFTVEADRKLVGELLKGVLRQKLQSAMQCNDLPKYRLLLNHQSVLLRNSGTTLVRLNSDVPQVSSEPSERANDFLLENRFKQISDRDKAGWSPLLYAALGGKPEVVEALLLQGADPNDQIQKVQSLVMFVKGTPALSICAVQQHNEAMQVLLRFRADPNKQDPGGSSPLFYVCSSDNVEGAKILMKAGADLSLTSVFGTNAFDQACAMGASKLLKEVHKAPPHAASRREAIGLAMTMGHGNVETILVLLQMGCDKDGVVRQRNTLGKLLASAMAFKHCFGHSNAMTALFYYGTNATPLMRSILSGSYTCAHLLIESNARVDLHNCKHQILRTAFDLAVQKHAPDSLLWQLWKQGAGDYASKASISWWCSNAPERFPVEEFSVTSQVSNLEENESDPMISVFF